MEIKGKRLIVTQHEWGENLAALQSLAHNAGVRIKVLPSVNFKEPDLKEWAASIDDDVAAIFVPMIRSICGHCYPIEAIGALPKPAHTKFIVDAAQALGSCAEMLVMASDQAVA